MKTQNISAILGTILETMNNTHADSMGEFTEKAPSKEKLIAGHKDATNFKWLLFDGITSAATMMVNQYRARQFEHLDENAEKAAENEIKEREQRIQNLKENLGIAALEQKLEAQEKTLNEIKSILGQIQSAADKMQKEKDKKVKDLHVKDLHPAKISQKKEVEDEEWT